MQKWKESSLFILLLTGLYKLAKTIFQLFSWLSWESLWDSNVLDNYLDQKGFCQARYQKATRREILQNQPHNENKQTSDTSNPLTNLQSKDKSILWSAFEECIAKWLEDWLCAFILKDAISPLFLWVYIFSFSNFLIVTINPRNLKR